MVNLTIRLSKAGGGSPGVKQEQQAPAAAAPAEGPAIPPHLADVELPLVRGLGTVCPEACSVNLVGVKARRRPGDKVHICVRCNFPIAVYGRLDPCEHVYCLACAKLDSTCFLCDERVVRIQKMDVLEGIFICGAPGCLRSFLARPEFEWHVADAHPQLLQPEPGKIPSPVRSIAPATPVPQAQVQSQQAGQRHADPAAPPVRLPSGNLQVIMPKKEEPQRKPPKAVRQDPPAARPIPELRLPDQFPHHRGGGSGDQHVNHMNHDGKHDLGPRERDQKPQQRHKEWEMQMQGRRERENEREQRPHEGGQGQRERGGGDMGPLQSPWKREKERDARGPPRPPSHPPPKELQKQREHHPLQAQPSQQQQPQPATLPPPPPPYPPPPSFAPSFPPPQEATGFLPRFEPLRGFHPGMHVPPRPEFHDNTPPPRLRHPGPPMGMPQGERPMNPNPQDGFGQSGGPQLRPMNGNQQDGFGQNGPPRPPHFHGEFGPPPMVAPRFHDSGHLLPPPPPGPPPKRTKLNGHPGPPSGPVPAGDPMMDYGWGHANPGNFGGPPGGHVFPGWLPPANA